MINSLGLVSCTIAFCISIFILFKSAETGHATHASILPIILAIMVSRPVSTLLLVLIFFSPILLFILANQYALKQIAQKLIQNNFDTLIAPLLQKIIHPLKNTKLLNEGQNLLTLKNTLINQITNSSSHKWLKRLINHAINKIKLDNTDLTNMDDIDNIIILKVKRFMEENSNPSLKSISIVFAIQWIFVLVIWLLPTIRYI